MISPSGHVFVLGCGRSDVVDGLGTRVRQAFEGGIFETGGDLSSSFCQTPSDIEIGSTFDCMSVVDGDRVARFTITIADCDVFGVELDSLSDEDDDE